MSTFIKILATLRVARFASVLGLSKMSLVAQKHLEILKCIMLDNFCLINIAKKSIPGVVRARVLQVPVYRLPAWSGPEIRTSSYPGVISGPRAFIWYPNHEPRCKNKHF